MTKQDKVKAAFIVGFVLVLAIFRVIFNAYGDKSAPAPRTPLEVQNTNVNFSNVLSAHDTKLQLQTGGPNLLPHK